LIELLPLKTLVTLVIVAVDIALVLTCTRAGYPVRFAWCALLRWRYTRWLWSIFLCPHCNAWWSGFGVGLISGHTIIASLQVAFTACAAVLILQRKQQRDFGIAIGEVAEDQSRSEPQHWVNIQGVSLEPPEDFEEILGLKE